MNERSRALKRVIVTGAGGPLGISLINECVGQGAEVCAVVRPQSAKIQNIPEHRLVSVVQSDISDIETLINSVEGGFDAFFHLAWTHTGDAGRDDVLLQSDNIRYALLAAKTAAFLGCKVFVGTGSQAEYGAVNQVIDESTEEKPVTAYGMVKLAAGKLVAEYCRSLGIRCNWVRVFSVYGPHENDYILTSYVIRTLLDNKKPTLTQCEQIWDYLYCEDAANALYLIAKEAKESGVYCLGSGEGVKLKDAITVIRNTVDPRLPLVFGEKPYSDNQIMLLVSDITKLKNDTSFLPKTDFIAGIAKTIDWYRRKSC
jgi:nucleoside-diphosphate-sugar epimerase